LSQKYKTPTPQYTEVSIRGKNGSLLSNPSNGCTTFSNTKRGINPKRYADSSPLRSGRHSEHFLMSNKLARFKKAYEECNSNRRTLIGSSNAVYNNGNKE